MQSIFSGLITSKTRIRILMGLFLNPERQAYLREFAREFNISPSRVKDELRQLSDAELLTHSKVGRQILYRANREHPLFNELHSMVKKALGMDRILESIISRLGKLEKAYLVDDYAEGKDTGLMDLVLIGNIDQTNLKDLVGKTEKYLGRKIRTLVLTSGEFATLSSALSKKPVLLLWSNEPEK